MQRYGSRGDETPPHRLRVPALSPAEADHRRPDHRVRPTAASATSAANTEAADRAVKAEIARLQNEIGHILSEAKSQLMASSAKLVILMVGSAFMWLLSALVSSIVWMIIAPLKVRAFRLSARWRI
mgnify:CR=1 FL=1